MPSTRRQTLRRPRPAFDDEATELDFVPGIEPAFGVSDAPHPNLIPPYQHPCAAEQLYGPCLGGERPRRRRATPPREALVTGFGEGPH